MKSKNIKLEENLHRRIKVLCAKRSIEIGAVINSIVLTYLEKEKA